MPQNPWNLDEINASAFENLCYWLESSKGKQPTYENYLPIDVPAYSVKHLQRKILQHFGDRITVSGSQGDTNVITLHEKVNSILHNTYVDQDIELEDQGISDANKIGVDIGNILRENHLSQEYYASAADINIEQLDQIIPPILESLISSMLTPSCSESAKRKQNILKISVSHVIMQAASKAGYISPLLLCVGIFIHQTTRSRVIIDVLSALGLSASCNEVLTFKRSAAATRSGDFLPSRTSVANVKFCQWVADNFDLNDDTLTGDNTTHAMGIISCFTPKFDFGYTEVRRQKISAAEISRIAESCITLEPYKGQTKAKFCTYGHIVPLSNIIYKTAT